MKKVTEREIRITGVPLDLGASRRGTDVGPSALRIAGLGAHLRRLGYEVAREEDIAAPAMETGTPEDIKARFKPQILDVCTQLAAAVKADLEEDAFPLVIGGDHSIAMGTISGVTEWGVFVELRDEDMEQLYEQYHTELDQIAGVQTHQGNSADVMPKITYMDADAAALAVAETPQQVVELLDYVISGRLA